MQTDTTRIIFQKVPMLTEEQQKKILEMTESFLSSDTAKEAWTKLRKAVAENQIDSGLRDFAEQHDHYIYGTEKKSSVDPIFVDTAAWIALLDTADAHHEHAIRSFDELQSNNTRLITTEFVLLELGDGFSAIGKRGKP